MTDDRELRDRRNVESVVLAKLIERHPIDLSRTQIVEDLTTVVSNPARVAAIHMAVDGLVEVGLLVCVGIAIRPTPAALRAGELELGL
jgi:hypothetical protein